MENTNPTSFRWFRGFSRTKIIAIVAIVVLGLTGYFIFRPKTSNYQFITVERKPIVESVSVTGNTTPTLSVSLGFGNSGNIAHVYSSVGKSVKQGQVLAELNTSDLSSQVRQAQAGVDAQQAKLESLQAGSRPEDIAVAQSTLISYQNYLNQLESNTILDATRSDLNTAINSLVTVSDMQNNGDAQGHVGSYDLISLESQVLQLIYGQPDLGGTGSWYFLKLDGGLKAQINSGNIEDLPQILSNTKTALTETKNMLDIAYSNLSLNAGTAANKAEVTTASTNVLNALNDIANQSQSLITAGNNVNNAQAALDLKKAGSSLQDIQAQKAQVESAQAQLQSAQSKLQNSQIIAPISGIITQFDAKVGQYGSPGTTLVSIISSNSFEIDALVSETDVAKVSLGNKVNITLDAFPGEAFAGSVFYVDPAQTTSEGVVGYKIKIAFDKGDSRMKSGLTANLGIETRSKDNVLILPQYAILQNDQGAFVEVLENKIVKNIPVVLGLQDQKGNVEVVSGVNEGEQVLNIGLKQK